MSSVHQCGTAPPSGAFAPVWRYETLSPRGPNSGGLVCGDWLGEGAQQVLVRILDGMAVLDAGGKRRARFPVDRSVEIRPLTIIDAVGESPVGGA